MIDDVDDGVGSRYRVVAELREGILKAGDGDKSMVVVSLSFYSRMALERIDER